MTFDNGDTYVGEFARGKFSGLGKYIFYGGGFDNGIWEKGELIERLDEGVATSKKKSEEKEVETTKEQLKSKQQIQMESSLPECEGSPLEAKNKLSNWNFV